MDELTHINQSGKATMVDVSEKQTTTRTAKAYGKVILGERVFRLVANNNVEKGDVLTTAKIAGISAAKKCSDLIPLCHNIFISKVDVELQLNEKDFSVEIFSFAKTTAQTGIEMEALTATSIAALTIYDMCKGVDKSLVIKDIHLLSKTGGKSGEYSYTGLEKEEE
ncbi:MAG: cyclic pyranopterin monophosphate synthase MoaC [Melioribacteraceae bacterium]|nr:cyclic pyranopterin monophosphate synthase MoaC [Melioribacteraceae bacterium]